MSRDCKDILQTKVTCINANNGMFGGVYQQTDISVLDCISRLPKQFKHNIDIVRSYEYHSQEQKEAKVRLIPTFILSGTYPYKKICDKDIITKANLLAVDIDYCDNEGMNVVEMRNKIFGLPYVFGVYKSVSDKGLFAIIAIEDTAKTKLYVPEIARVWSKLYGIKIDQKCSNIARKRFASYDPDWKQYTKFEGELDEWDREWEDRDKIDSSLIPMKVYRVGYNRFDENKIQSKDIAKYLINKGFSIEGVNEWFAAACNLYNIDEGDELFLQLSRQSKSYVSDEDCMRTFRSAKNYADEEENTIKYWIGKAKKYLGQGWYKEIVESKSKDENIEKILN